MWPPPSNSGTWSFIVYIPKHVIILVWTITERGATANPQISTLKFRRKKMERASIPYSHIGVKYNVMLLELLDILTKHRLGHENLTCSYITISHQKCPRKQTKSRNTWLTTIVMHLTSRPCNKRHKNTPQHSLQRLLLPKLVMFQYHSHQRARNFLVKIASRFFQRPSPKSLTAILPLRKPLPTVVPELKDVGHAVLGVTLSLGIRTWSKVRWPRRCEQG